MMLKPLNRLCETGVGRKAVDKRDQGLGASTSCTARWTNIFQA